MWECGLKHRRGVYFGYHSSSLPMWECGLKLFCAHRSSLRKEVTPHVGVWIETLDNPFCDFVLHVTPHVGVWIETFLNCSFIGSFTSLPMWECGLKLISGEFEVKDIKSLPMWECGLKLKEELEELKEEESLPMWECGLKRNDPRKDVRQGYVTPHVGVWIETLRQ